MLMHDRPLAVDFAEAEGRAKPQVCAQRAIRLWKLLYDFASRIPSYSPDFSDMMSVLFRFINTTNDGMPAGHLY